MGPSRGRIHNRLHRLWLGNVMGDERDVLLVKVCCAISGTTLSSLATVITLASPVYGQSITAEVDGTGTEVMQSANQYDITGGTAAGQNLFHSFDNFGLDPGERANFITQPDVLNVLGRITGGNPSVIDGLVTVSGSQAHLYLLNPVGILLGADAQLNLPAGFTVTTADGIGFGGGIFDAVGGNDYAALVGDPNALLFRVETPGAVVNTGDLSLGTGESLVLAGGTVVNTGSLQTAGGTVDIAAVPGGQRVRISPVGSILSYEVARGAMLLGMTPLTLPELLTGSDNIEGITVAGDNAVRLGQLIIPAEVGTAIVAGQIDVDNPSGMGGTLTLLGETTGVVDAWLTAVGQDGGGNIFVGGDYQGAGALPNAQVTYVSEDSILDASAGQIGHGGQVIVWSDHTTRSDGQILARGGAQLGDGGLVETSSRRTLETMGIPDVSAINGEAGTWLIDPLNVTISAAASTNVTGVSPFIPALPGGAILNITDLNTALNLGNVIISTVGTPNLPGETGDIILDAALNYTLTGGATTLQLQAAGNIFINQSILPNSTPNALTLTLQADATGAGTGTAKVAAAAVVNTNGGNLTMLGNGTTLGAPGVSITGTVNTLGGNVVLTGTGSGFPTGQGVEIDNGASVNAGGGNITLTGNSDNDAGVLINGNLTSFGAITATGTSSSLYGIHLDTPGSIADGFTALNFLGTSTTNDGIRVEDDIVVVGTSGPVTLTGNSTSGRGVFVGNQLDAGLDSLSVTGNSNGAAAIQIVSEVDAGAGVTLNGFGGDIITETINASGPVTIATNRSLRVTGISGFGSSIQANGFPLTVTHGGNGVVPFIVGNAAVNGTLGRITSGPETILPTQSFLGDYIQGNIQILTNVFLTPTVPVTSTVPTLTNLPTCFADCLPQLELDSPQIAINIGDVDSPLTVDPSLRGRIFEAIDLAETDYVQEFTEYLGLEGDTFQKPDLPKVQADLNLVAEATGIKPAIVYVSFIPPTAEDLAPIEQALEPALGKSRDGFWSGETARTAQPNDLLELIVVTPGGVPIRKTMSVTHAQVERVANQLRSQVSNRFRVNSQTYLTAAQQLYEWMMAPLEAELSQQEIGNLAFVMSSGLRSLPVSALHDGEQFLIERYSVGLVPSVSLTDFRYVDVRDSEVLAMGASSFVDQPELPAVPLELSTIAERLWPGDFLINETFTPDLLISSRQDKPYGIVHLATHGEFKPGSVDNSYIQFWDQRLGLDQVRALGLNNPPVELMVLSACRTALGNEEAELGFAGLAIQAGVKTALASLWKVDDVGTAGLMTQFYTSLREEPIKAEALRQAQLAMVRGDITVKNGLLTWSGGEIALPPELANVSSDVFSHPYFWAAFTVIGSPW